MSRNKKRGSLGKVDQSSEGKLRRLWRDMEKTQETGCRKKLSIPAGRISRAQKKKVLNCVKQSIHARYVSNYVMQGPKKRK